MRLDGRTLHSELGDMATALGSDWSASAGAADAYGLKAMSFVQLQSPSRQISIRVWFSGRDVRVGAFLGVPYEASDETWFRSTGELVAFVRHLCVGEFERRDGGVWVRVGRRRHALTEFSDDLVDLADPWADGHTA
jgi:hypothetical protein